MRYYYTDPLAAAWMVDKFGMQLNDGIGSPQTVFHYAYEVGIEKFYIDADCLQLLEPQIDDVIDSPIGVVKIMHKEHCNLSSKYTDLEGAVSMARKWINIISRGGIAFMWPENE